MGEIRGSSKKKWEMKNWLGWGHRKGMHLDLADPENGD